MEKTKIITPSTFYVIFLVAVLILGYVAFDQIEQNSMLKEAVLEIEQENSKLEQKNKILVSQLEDANRTISEKNKEIEELSGNVSHLNKELLSVDEKIVEVKSKLDEFEREIQDSMDWFRQNSNTSNFFQYRSLNSQLLKCVRITEEGCRIKLACFDLIHDKYKEFSYAYDNYTSNSTDQLQSLAEFYGNKMGDCEDFSLLMKAEINSVKHHCIESGSDDFLFEVAQYDSGSSYFVDFTEEWFYPNAEQFRIPESYDNVYVACGNYPAYSDPNDIASSASFGHCALAFTDHEMKNGSDISLSLRDSIIIEPQSAFLLFDQRDDDVLFVPEDGDLVFGRNLYIWAVITDDDYYIYDRHEKRWRGYKDFLPEIREMESELKDI